MMAFNDFNLGDISGIVGSIFAFRFPMSNDNNKCEGFSNLNCFSIISKFKSLFGSKLIDACAESDFIYPPLFIHIKMSAICQKQS
jgi:hypothetical protein